MEISSQLKLKTNSQQNMDAALHDQRLFDVLDDRLTVFEVDLFPLNSGVEQLDSKTLLDDTLGRKFIKFLIQIKEKIKSYMEMVYNQQVV